MKILTIQHASTLGGSCVSLALTAQGLQERGHEVIVALARPSEPVKAYFEKKGFRVLPWPLLCWHHSTVVTWPAWNPLTWLRLLRIAVAWRRARKETLRLVNMVRPDVVHLNSMPLSASASTLANAGVPFVWHVREPPPDQGWRTRHIRRIMRRAPGLIFLSEFDRMSWMGEARGDVIHNFVDGQRFSPSMDQAAARAGLGLAGRHPVLLYLGGTSRVKGAFVLIKALALLKSRLPNFVCLMPGTQWQQAHSFQIKIARRLLPVLGGGTALQRLERDICKNQLHENVRRMPFRDDVEILIAACDFLVFPATRSHFARPIIEAAAMGKPAVASRLGGIDELIQDQKTGMLIEPDAPCALACAIEALACSRERMSFYGKQAYEFSQIRFSMRAQVNQIESILLQTKENCRNQLIK